MKLWEPSKCCCCCDTRTGSIVIGVILLVGGASVFLNGIQTLVSNDSLHAKIFCNGESDIEEDQCIKDFLNLEHGLTWGSLVNSSFHIVFSSLLLYGIVKKKTTFFIPLMTVYLIQICAMILISVGVLILLIYIELPFGLCLFTAVIFGSIIFLETYCLLVIRVHYLDIKREKGQVHISLNEEEALPANPPEYSSPAPPYSDNTPAPPYPGNNDAPPGYPVYYEKQKNFN